MNQKHRAEYFPAGYKGGKYEIATAELQNNEIAQL